MNKILLPNDVNLTDNQFSLLSQAFGAQINIGRNFRYINYILINFFIFFYKIPTKTLKKIV